MLLTSIQISGFKSFADKTVLKFGRGITAVVGPNGSGKSNISDAVRWVLGEQSTKSLRGQSMEDVIFGGTETRRPHGFCEVTLNIDNSDRSLNFDNDSVSITRRYYRSHESEYLINNVSVRLRDVNELFMDTGLGRDGYSMIGQGRIDSIIRSRSDERRDIFEEAAGISKYRYRREDALRKLAAAEDNLLRLKDIMDELEARVGPLEEQSKKAEKFLTLAEEKKRLEIGIWLDALNHSKETLRNQEAKITTAQMQYNEIEEALQEFDAKTEQNSANFARLTSEIEAQRTAGATANEEIVKLQGSIDVLENDIHHNNESIERLNGETQQLGTSDEEARKEIENRLASAEEHRLASEQTRGQLAELEQSLSGLLSDSENISRRIEEQVRRLNGLSAESADHRVTLTTANTSIEEIAQRHGTIDALLQQHETTLKELEAEANETEALLKQIEENIVSDQNALQGFTLRQQNRRTTLDELTAKHDEARLDIEAKKRRIQILTELEHNMEGFSHAVKKVMSDAETGVLRGVHGPVSKLITVDKKYSVAIETALGNAIQNIIVENENDSKRAISHLKNAKAGRATFLPVSSVRAREFKESGFENLYGFVGIASDLVSADSKYQEIIRYLLGATVVTEDIDSAVTLAKKYQYRVKVVSLDGQVIHPGGPMTGGSPMKQAGLLSRAADIERLESEVKRLEESRNKIAQDVQAATRELEAVEADMVAVRSALTTANEDKIRTLAELKRISDLRENALQTLTDLKLEKENSQQKTEELRKTADEAMRLMGEIESEKVKLQSEIDRMTGGRDELSTRREELSIEITACKLRLIEQEKDIEALKNEAESLEAAIGNRAQRVQEIAGEIAALSFRNEQLNQEIAAAKDSIEDQQMLIRNGNEAIERLIAERNETEQDGIRLRTAERERTSERERIGGELARLCERKETMAREYEDTIRQLYDEYQLTRSEAENMGIVLENPQEAKKTLHEVRAKIRALGNVNVSAIEEYKEVRERYDFMKAQIDDVEQARSELHKLILQLTSQMKELFIDGFDKINENFGKTFRELFGGGSATLTLSDPENVLESGIDINAKLPGKNVPSLEGLSGGEKALVALSIYFAIMRVNAPPFCFLDEVDTALDDINVDRFADYMKQSDLPTQFICVTHRRGTMEAADMLYGVTMQEKGITKLLELNVAELEKKLLAQQG